MSPYAVRHWLLPADWRVLGHAWLAAAVFLLVAGTLDALFRSHGVWMALQSALTVGILSAQPFGAFVLHPDNIARRFPSAPAPGWRHYAQFSFTSLALMTLWLVTTGGSAWWLAGGAASALAGWAFARRT